MTIYQRYDQSKFYLWSVDSDGEVNSLSSWTNSWCHIDCNVSKIKKFKIISATSWCIWAVGADNELYIYIPNSDFIIRSTETMIENQRKSSGIFSGKYLKPGDPAEFTTPNYYGRLIKTDLKSFQLPSSRWKWENDWKIRIHFNGQLTNEGWTYSNNFLRKFQIDRYFLSSNVRRRFWQRSRYFHAFDRWLYIGQEAKPFEISCSQDCCNDPEVGDNLVDTKSIGIIDISCGGEMLPHQKDGFISVWVANSNGQILCRLNVHRQNPEGSHWCVVKLPKYAKATSLTVGPLGSLFVCTCFGEIYYRENISWKNPLGTSWKSFAVPGDLWDKEQIIQITVSIYSIWVRSTLGRVWMRSNVNLHETRTKYALGDFWHLISTDIQFISASASEQLFAIHNNQTILYKSAKSNANFGKNCWTGKLPLDFRNNDKICSKKFTTINCSSLFLEDDVLPANWLQSPLMSHKTYIQKKDVKSDWKLKILSLLKERDDAEYKNPKFANYTTSFEQTFWSKASDCEVQCFASDDHWKIWYQGSVVLHHRIKNNRANATIHIDVKSVDIFKLNSIVFFIESHEVICLSKYHYNYELGLIGNAGSCLTIIIFTRNKIFDSTVKQNISRMLLKFPSETDVEDWIMATNFVSFTQRTYLEKSNSGQVWFVNQFNEPFSTYVKSSNDSLSSWQQDGGHFHIVESGAKGFITWAIGFNGIAWTHTKGWGGSYLGSICSSKEHLYPVSDMRSISVYEYQKLKYRSGEMNGRFLHRMWTDASGNIIRNKESVQLPSRRWHWFEDWSKVLSDDIEICDTEGWGYSTNATQKFDGNFTWNKTIRCRKWSRPYKTVVMGPWKEIRNNKIKIVDISIFPGVDYSEEKNHLILAVTSKHKLVLRKGVTINCPEGNTFNLESDSSTLSFREKDENTSYFSGYTAFSRRWKSDNGYMWLHLRSELKIISVTINRNGTVYVVCTSGFIWMLKFNNFKDITCINERDLEKISHPRVNGKFRLVSSGDNVSLWAIDTDNVLWMRTFTNDVGKSSVGTGWIYVSDKVSQVSCASYLLVWSVFLNGCLAERVGITKLIPQGTEWIVKLNGIAKYVSIRGT